MYAFAQQQQQQQQCITGMVQAAILEDSLCALQSPVLTQSGYSFALFAATAAAVLRCKEVGGCKRPAMSAYRPW
jgi:hypothetical protein